MFKKILIAFATLSAISVCTGDSQAMPLGPMAKPKFSAGTRPAPLPFAIFCFNNPAECKTSARSEVSYTPYMQRLVASVNDSVNRQIRFVNERSDVWQISSSSGDCDDFVMTKRHRLIKAGVPSSALRMAVVRTPSGEGHLILILKTSSGEYVLDNIRKTIVKRHETGYRFLRVSTANPKRWS